MSGASWENLAALHAPAVIGSGRPGRVARPKKRRTLTASQLKARGWTEGLIRSVLGAPDKRRKNPNYRSAAPLRLYFLGRVLDAEQ